MGPHGRFLVALGTSWSPLGPLLVPGRKKRRKVTWRTLALGSKLGLKIVTFPEKAATNIKKWAPRQGLEKGSCLEGVKTLKVMTITALEAVFLGGPGLPKRSPNRRGNGPGLHRG